MKRIYIKPCMRKIELNASTLLASSKNITAETSDDTASSFEILSNEEGKHDIWGNEGNGIW